MFGWVSAVLEKLFDELRKFDSLVRVRAETPFVSQAAC